MKEQQTNTLTYYLAFAIIIIGVIIIAINFIGQESFIEAFKGSAFGFIFISLGITFIAQSKKKSK